jgi:ATP-dependent helicase/nuclease subunit A
MGDGGDVMSTKPRRASDQQRQASDPAASVWVAANAGSGKTTVLVDRVIRLLLEGTAPERILCLTYTKAAAALMANRLFGELALWVTLGDAELKERIEATGVRHVDAARLTLARRLFTRALETPGGLKIQTIHAFCERLLQLFPIEAGIVPGFTVMDEAAARALLMEARNAALADAARSPESPAGQALVKVVARANADQLDELVSTLLKDRSEIAGILAGSQAVHDAIVALKQACGIGPDENAGAITNEMLAFDRRLYENLSLWLDGGSKTEVKASQGLRTTLDASPADLAQLLKVFFTQKYEPRKIVTKKRAEQEAEMMALLLAEQDRLDALLEKLSTLESVEATEALLLLGSEIVANYAERKRERGLYDFEDLIAGTRDLLNRGGAAQWVLYKLDRGIHHLLIDEAQDTSPAQWQIAQKLTEDFFSGRGAVEQVLRTVFAVGDRKQSIFSFQGADPDAFDEARSHFHERVIGAEQTFRAVDLAVSHRSGATILEAVDHVFAGDPAARGLLAPDEKHIPPHEPVRIGQAGRVEIWPLEERDEKDDPQPFEAPVDRPAANHPRRKLARGIAETVARWLKEGRRLEARGRAIVPGDILILVRARNLLSDALLNELRARGVPVAGADRLKLAESIAVQDLLALARFALNTEDDYSLACVLKSPLVQRGDGRSFDDDDLFVLAHGRGNTNLWERLRQAPEYAQIHAELREAIGAARELTPFAFFARVVTQYRNRIFSRLGPDAAEPLDAFLDLALDFELNNTPALTGFLAWFDEAGSEIKRDMEQEGGEVRIMTVHGAKGLEANIVFLADAADTPSNSNQPQLYLIDTEDYPEPLPLWKISSPRTAQKIGAWVEKAKARRMEEYRRLFYVAMTRACDELYVCGCKSRKKDNSESWCEMARQAFKVNGYAVKDGIIGRSLPQTGEPKNDRDAAAQERMPGALPAWAASPVAAEFERPSPEPADDRALDPAAAERGLIIHRLLEYLPRLRPEARHAAARRYVARNHAEPALADAVVELLQEPAFAALFGAEGLAEVSYEGTADAGRIDRLLMTETEALIVDYKSDRLPPASHEAVSADYLAQLRRYRETVKPLAGVRRIRAAILWTETAKLMEIPEAMLLGAS